ncbi:hypothetical protein AOLI_G00296600 [Acnodon oligacanthus]
MQTPLSALQWTDSSPCLFGSAKYSQQFAKDCGSLKKNDCFGLLDTPESSLAQDASAKRISESLGAQLNPDLSWSSSFNTPTAMSPTVILTKKEAQPSPVSLLRDKEVIIVRKLFPSLSKDTDTTSESASTAQHNVTDGNAKADESFDSVDGLWRQTVPHAIKDSDVRNTVESVLDGADDVLSIFFSNSGSALRRVKTKEKTKKRVNGVSRDVKSAELSTEHCEDNPLAAKVDPDMSPSKNCAASESKSPLKNKDFSQWSPLSLSDVQDSKAKQECFSELPNKHTNLVSINSDSEQLVLRDSITQPDQLSSCAAEKQKSCPDSYPERSQQRNSLLSPSPVLNFSRKARKFVYRVQSPCSLSIGRKWSATPGRSSQSLTDALIEKPLLKETSLANESNHTEDDTCTAGTGAFLVRSGLSTVKQQMYFEQEAMACTKALLEDDLNEHSLSETLEDTDSRKSPAVSQKRSFEAAIVEGKWMSDVGLTGQPPLKRRLISEFGHISDRASVCDPVKSSPNGTLRDRRVYNLKPNVTHPSRNFMDQKNSNSDLQTASSLSSGQKRGSDPKAVMFVPPFRKNKKSEVEKACIPRDVKVPSVFVPPVKKDSVVSVHHVRSSQKSSTDSESPSISSSGCEKKMANAEVKPHTLVKHGVEGMKKEKEVEEDVKLEDRSVQTHQEKVIETWQQSLKLALDMQDMRIRKKKHQSIRPLPGSFYLAKTSGVTRISLREAVEYKCPLQHTQEQLYQYGVHCNVSQITAENAESFRFSFDDFFKRKAFIENTGVQLADGGWLIPDNRGTMGKEEFYRALCDTPGVDPKLISEAWVFNHYRWIVWKRACMERAFPEVMGSRCLTPEQVLLQLKLRYDTEVDHSQRSALKKITERDDTPTKTLVLCMCGIAKSGHSEARTEKSVATTDAKSESPAVVIWLTDGWYSIKALLDPPLSAMVQKGHLRVGGKVMIHGAELVGSQDACPPLEAPDSLMLKVSANSTRRARWDSKLGFHKDPRPFRLPLSSLYPNGGVVGCVDIIVLRSYPTQWMEKKSVGVFVFRNDRAEDREARRHSSAKQKTMELLFSKIQAQFEKEEEDKKKNRRRRFRCHEIENLQDGEDLYEAMESDPAYVEANLSAGQMEAVSSYRRSVAERRQAELQDRLRKAVQESEGGCPDRDVTPVWKLAITDFNNSNCIYTLNIWRPSVELRSLLREGCRYKAYHLATSMTKKRSGTTTIQFTATKKTQFQDIEVCPEWLSTHFPVRHLASFRDLQNPGFSSRCGEVDVVGYVVSILDRQAPSPVLYLVDDKFDFISVRSFTSLVQLAVEDLVKPFALLAVSNLQLRELSGPVPRLYAGEQALFSINPKETHLQEAVAHLKTFVQSYENFFNVAEEKLSNLISPGNLKSAQSPRTLGVASMPKPNNRMNITPQQPRVFSPFTPVTKRAPASTVQTPEAKDPKSLKRKRGFLSSR